MEKLKNAIYATAMDNYIRNAYEDTPDEYEAEEMLERWLQVGVPDGNELSDNIMDFGDNKDYNELACVFDEICEDYDLNGNFSKYVEEISKNIVEMLDNPYYNMV